MDIYELISKECQKKLVFSKKDLAQLLGLRAQTFIRYVADELIQPHQEPAIREAIETKKFVEFPDFEYICSNCSSQIVSQKVLSRTTKKYCIECSKNLGKRIEATKPKKRVLSINDILRIGKKHQIIGEGGLVDYGRTVQAIENGKIKLI